MEKRQVNVISSINSSSNISKKMIDGKSHYVIKNVVPVVDDIVMNGILYEGSEIDRSYQSMAGKLMPYDHPKVNGQYVSVYNPIAINNAHIGAWAENLSKSGNRVLLDMNINIDYAKQTEGGIEVISRIESLINNEKADPIHISTGLFRTGFQANGVSKGKEYHEIARDIEFDHIAILPPGVIGAGTPEEGVGIFYVNGEELKREIAYLEHSKNNDESTNKINKSAFKKIIEFVTNKNLSFSDISDQIRSKIRKKTGEEWSYIIEVFNDEFAYEFNGDVFIQKYHIDDNSVVIFDGEPALGVVRKEIETLDINEADMTKDEIKALFADALKPIAEQLNKTSQENNAAITAVKDEMQLIKNSITASSEKEEKKMRDEIKEKLKLSDAVVNSLKDEALAELYSKAQTSSGLTGDLAANSDSGISEIDHLREAKQ